MVEYHFFYLKNINFYVSIFPNKKKWGYLMYINRNEIEDLYEILYYGTYGTIYKVKYNNQIYGQKKFIPDMYTPSLDDVKKNEKFCNINTKEDNIFLPRYLEENDYLHSYLTLLYDGINFRYLFEKPIDVKLDFLRKAKDLILKTNNDYGIIHSDIHFGNLMYNDDKKTVALVDFDASKYEGLECEKCYLSEYAKRYITYNKYDDKLDIYLFNLLTLGLIFDQRMEHSYIDLNCRRFHNYFYSKSAIKTLEDMSKIQGNKNFLIDMIDDNVKLRILKLG